MGKKSPFNLFHSKVYIVVIIYTDRRMKITKNQRTVTKSANNNNNKYICRDFESCTVSVTHSPLYAIRFVYFHCRCVLTFYYYILLLHLLFCCYCCCRHCRRHRLCRKKPHTFFRFRICFFPPDGISAGEKRKILKTRILHIPNK